MERPGKSLQQISSYVSDSDDANGTVVTGKGAISGAVSGKGCNLGSPTTPLVASNNATGDVLTLKPTLNTHSLQNSANFGRRLERKGGASIVD